MGGMTGGQQTQGGGYTITPQDLQSVGIMLQDPAFWDAWNQKAGAQQPQDWGDPSRTTPPLPGMRDPFYPPPAPTMKKIAYPFGVIREITGAPEPGAYQPPAPIRPAPNYPLDTIGQPNYPTDENTFFTPTPPKRTYAYPKGSLGPPNYEPGPYEYNPPSMPGRPGRPGWYSPV